MLEIIFSIDDETISYKPSAFTATEEFTMYEYSSSQFETVSFYASPELSLKRIALLSSPLFDYMVVSPPQLQVDGLVSKHKLHQSNKQDLFTSRRSSQKASEVVSVWKLT